MLDGRWVIITPVKILSKVTTASTLLSSSYTLEDFRLGVTRIQPARGEVLQIVFFT